MSRRRVRGDDVPFGGAGVGAYDPGRAAPAAPPARRRRGRGGRRVTQAALLRGLPPVEENPAIQQIADRLFAWKKPQPDRALLAQAFRPESMSAKVTRTESDLFGRTARQVDLRLNFKLRRGATFQSVVPTLVNVLSRRALEEAREIAGRSTGRYEGMVVQVGMRSAHGPAVWLTEPLGIQATGLAGDPDNPRTADRVNSKLMTAMQKYIRKRLTEDTEYSPPLEAFYNAAQPPVPQLTGARTRARVRAHDRAVDRHNRLVAQREALFQRVPSNRASAAEQRGFQTDLLDTLNTVSENGLLALRIVLPMSREVEQSHPRLVGESMANILPLNRPRVFRDIASAPVMMLMRGVDDNYMQQHRTMLRLMEEVLAKTNVLGQAYQNTRVSTLIPYTVPGGCFWYAYAVHLMRVEVLETKSAKLRYRLKTLEVGDGTSFWDRQAKGAYLAANKPVDIPRDSLWNMSTTLLDTLAPYMQQVFYLYDAISQALLYTTPIMLRPLHYEAKDVCVMLMDTTRSPAHVLAVLSPTRVHLALQHKHKGLAWWCHKCGDIVSKKTKDRHIRQCIGNVFREEVPAESSHLQRQIVRRIQEDQQAELQERKCKFCKLQHTQKQATSDELSAHCPTCNITHRLSCLEEHIAQQQCKTWHCDICSQPLASKDAAETHICGERFCKTCLKMELVDHVCYMTRKEAKPPCQKIIAFDSECYLDEVLDEEHLPTGNVAHSIAMIVVSYVYDSPVLSDPDFEEYRQGDYFIFDSPTFIRWLLRPCHQDYRVYAHNMSGYDGHLILEQFHAAQPPIKINGVVFNANRIMQFCTQTYNITFLDSAKSMPMRLANLPKSFGFQDMSKGHFPYRFATTANAYYRGEMPGLHLYLDDQMQSPEVQQDTQEWYERECLIRQGQILEGQRQVMFDMQEEMTTYCIQDVCILKTALQRFQELFYQLTGVDPLQQITIASTVMQIYRTKYMPEEPETIAQLGPREQDFIRRAYRGGFTTAVHLIANYRALGSYGQYHDVCSHYPNVMRSKPLPIGAPRWLFVDLRPEDLSQWFGFVHCRVTCPKDLLLGILPARRKVTMVYPDGHQEITEKLEFNLYDKTDVWTTAELQLAVQHGYVIEEVISVLHWDRADTSLFRNYIDTFTVLKTVAAGPKGMDLATRQDYFRRMIVDHLQIQPTEESYTQLRQTCLDWIKNSQAPELKTLREEQELTHVDLPTLCAVFSAVANPGLKQLCKLCLNSLYGKFGQQPLRAKVEPVYSIHELRKILSNPEHLVKDMCVMNGAKDVVYMKYIPHANSLQKRAESWSIPALAAFITSYARLGTWQRAFDAGLENVSYMDTDSVISRHDMTLSKQPPEGEFLGDWEREGGDIDELIALASKTYCMRFADGKEAAHSKGWTRSEDLKHMFTMDFFRDTLLKGMDGGETKASVHPTIRFQSDGKHGMFTKVVPKIMRAVVSKRCIHNVTYDANGEIILITTIPHGHQDCPHTVDEPLLATEVFTPFAL